MSLRNVSELSHYLIIPLTYLLAIYCCAVELVLDFIQQKTVKGEMVKWEKSRLLSKKSTRKEKVAVMTGADGKIGREVLKTLLDLDFKVICFGLNLQSKHDNVIFLKCDLNDLKATKKAAEELESLKISHVDLAVFCAGVMMYPPQKSLNPIDPHFAVNLLSHAQLFNSLRPYLEKSSAGSKVIFVSSSTCRLGSIDHLREDDKPFRSYKNGYKSYADSKLALSLYGKALARNLPNNQIKVISLHPGVVSSNLYQFVFPPFRFVIIKLLKYVLRTAERAAIEILNPFFDDSLDSGVFLEYGRQPQFMDKFSSKDLNLVYEAVQREIE